MLILALALLATPTDLERYDAHLVVSEHGDELPFGLELGIRDGEPVAFLVNEPERIQVPVVAWDGQRLRLEMPHYRSVITAAIGDEGGLVGQWTKVRGKDNVAQVPFRARLARASQPRAASAEAPLSVDGRWAVAFAEDELGAVGVFTQPAGEAAVRGTFLTATGDYRYLAGSLDGSHLRLSCFDGAHAFLFDAVLADDGTLTGVFHSGNWWHETWYATRDADAHVVDPFAQTTWDERLALADLAFPDLDGKLRSLADPEFAGKGTLLVLFGSWCPNCHDEAPYLVELHERYGERGLSILGLSFELTGEFRQDARQVAIFRERYGIEYPLFVAGTSDKTKATEAFAALDRVRSYPTTLFLESDGSVLAIHSGYAGPATGAEHTELRREFETNIERLLAEEPATDAEVWTALTATAKWSGDDYAGATTSFFVQDGERRARYVSHGGGVPIRGQEAVPVKLVGEAVWLGDQMRRYDRRAGVLLDPLRFAGRLHPENDVAPFLTARSVTTDAELVAALADEDALVRREAVVALVTLRRLAGADAPEVGALLLDQNLGVRLAAAWAAGQLQHQHAVQDLAGLLESPNAGLRREATRALARLTTSMPSLVNVLRPLDDDPDPLVRRLAREAIASADGGR